MSVASRVVALRHCVLEVLLLLLLSHLTWGTRVPLMARVAWVLRPGRVGLLRTVGRTPELLLTHALCSSWKLAPLPLLSGPHHLTAIALLHLIAPCLARVARVALLLTTLGGCCCCCHLPGAVLRSGGIPWHPLHVLSLVSRVAALLLGCSRSPVGTHARPILVILFVVSPGHHLFLLLLGMILLLLLLRVSWILLGLAASRRLLLLLLWCLLLLLL